MWVVQINILLLAAIHLYYAAAIEFLSYNSINTTRKAAKAEGHIILGGLFPVHSHNEMDVKSVCGTLNHERGIHRLEAMFYATDIINQNTQLLQNLTLGVEIRDTCNLGTYALEESVPFVIGSLDHHDANCANTKRTKIQAVIGAASSSISIQTANLLRLFRLPQVSYASTSADLNDRQRFKYFLRTVPPDTYQAQAMIDIIMHFNWTSVHGIYSEGNYGRQGMEHFKKYAKDKNICLISASQVNARSDFKALLKRLTNFKNTHTVVLFLSTAHIQLLLSAASKLEVQFKFKWLASDYWGTRTRFISNSKLKNAADGAITLTLQTKSIQGFETYFKNLSVKKNSRNPWFSKFWEESFNCTFSDLVSKEKLCHGNESFPSDYKFDDKVPYVLDAVFAISHAINFALQKSCMGTEKTCKKQPIIEGNVLLNALSNISFNGTLGLVKFDENGSTLREYEIMEFVDGEYRRVGTWLNHLTGTLHLRKPMQSFCAVSCHSGEIKIPRNGLACCYNCHQCGFGKYATVLNQCVKCPQNHKPNRTRTGCESLSVHYINHGWVIAMTGISGIGVILTFAVVFVFLYYDNTAVVKASGRNLSYPLLTGVILCYIQPYILLSNPSTTTCGFSRFGLGFCFCISYTALAIKTKHFDRKFKFHQTSNTGGRKTNGSITVLLIMSVTILVQALLAVAGLFVDKITLQDYVSGYNIVRLCKIPLYDFSVAYCYNILLIMTCIIFAYRTRKAPAPFNEAKCIGFVMWTTCILWIVFIPVYFGLSTDYKFIAICMHMNLSATSILAGVFGPKVYIILLRPARNIGSRSGIAIRHVYSNQSFEEDISASARKMTTLTEIDVEV